MKRTPIRADKLDLLRRGDPFRKWTSLDDHRVCAVCDKRISGRQVEVALVRGKPQLSCPTEGCNGGPREWVYPGNPLTSKRSWLDWSRLWEDEPVPALVRRQHG
ncbi:MAG TPA: hypothetical protein VGC85_04335 [Chthoniobacterales bacterium]